MLLPYVLDNDELFLFKVEALEQFDLVSPKTNTDGFELILQHNSNYRSSFIVRIGCLFLNVIDEPNYIHELMLNWLIVVFMVPVVIIDGKCLGEFFIMDLNYLVLFILKPDLRSSVLQSHNIKSSNVIALHFFQEFLVVHCYSSCKVDSYKLIVFIHHSKVANSHETVLCLFPCGFKSN